MKHLLYSLVVATLLLTGASVAIAQGNNAMRDGGVNGWSGGSRGDSDGGNQGGSEGAGSDGGGAGAVGTHMSGGTMYRDGTVRGGDGSRGAGSEGAGSDPPTPALDGLESISRDDFPLPTASAIESPARDPEPKPENSDSLKPHPERDAIHPTLSPLELWKALRRSVFQTPRSGH